jgi:hypothetical protein
MEVIMATDVRTRKPMALLVGGKGHNVPKELGRHFNLIRHIHQDSSIFIAPKETEIVLVIRDWVSHRVIQRIQDQLPHVPLVAARAGWSHMVTELVRRGLLPEGDPIEPKAEKTEDPMPERVEEPPAPKGNLNPFSPDEFLRVLADFEGLKQRRDEACRVATEAWESYEVAKGHLNALDADLEKYQGVLSYLKLAQAEIEKIGRES